MKAQFPKKIVLTLESTEKAWAIFHVDEFAQKEAGPLETRLESHDSDWTMTDNKSRTLKTTFAAIDFVRKKILFLPVGSVS